MGSDSTYAFEEAALTYSTSISRATGSVQLRFSGYNDKLVLLIETVLVKLQNLEVSETLFAQRCRNKGAQQGSRQGMRCATTNLVHRPCALTTTRYTDHNKVARVLRQESQNVNNISQRQPKAQSTGSKIDTRSVPSGASTQRRSAAPWYVFIRTVVGRGRNGSSDSSRVRLIRQRLSRER